MNQKNIQYQKKIKKTFKNQIINEQYRVDNKYLLILFFLSINRALKLMKMDTWTDLKPNKEKQKGNEIIKKADFEIIRINSDKEILIFFMKLVKYSLSFMIRVEN